MVVRSIRKASARAFGTPALERRAAPPDQPGPLPAGRPAVARGTVAAAICCWATSRPAKNRTASQRGTARLRHSATPMSSGAT